MKNNGFSLIELMVTLALVGVILSIGLPSMQDFIKSEQLDTQVTLLHTHIGLARSEAVKRGQAVTICAGTYDSASKKGTCSGNWHGGWIVFEDLDEDSAADTGETVIKVQQALQGGSVNRSIAGGVMFGSRGFTTSANSTFTICDEDGAATTAKGIILMATGSSRRTADRVGTDKTHENHAGSALTCS